MYCQQHHAKVSPHKITYIIKKGNNLIDQYQKKLLQLARNEIKERKYKSNTKVKYLQTVWNTKY